MAERHLSTIFLLGAGSSKPAGLSTITELTSEFVSDPIKAMGWTMFSGIRYEPKGGTSSITYDETIIKEKISYLAEVTKDFFKGKMDLELLMSIILRLKDKNEKKLFHAKYPELKQINDELLDVIKNLTESYIRKKCENIQTVDYLWPLQGLANMDPMEIFTLNYDATVEIFCEKNGIQYTDGFDPYWNPEIFAKNLGINVYKLHGSLYWFRTESGKVIKVPMKGLTVSNVRYLTDESVSEMMIYPVLQKNKESMVYSWLSQKFKEELNRYEFCVIIGYSFRDDEIKNTIIESLSSNKNLWLVIVNPTASELKRSHFSNDVSLSSRILTMDIGIEGAVTERKLHTILQSLPPIRMMEERTFTAQKTSQHRLDTEWRHILRYYISVSHHDRIKWIVEWLLKQKFDGRNGSFPDSLEGILCANALQYMIEYHSRGEIEKCEMWKRIFEESCILYEYKFFADYYHESLRKNNPVKENELPEWYQRTGGTGVDIKQLKDSLEQIPLNIVNKELQRLIQKLIRSCDVLIHQTRIESGWTNPTPEEILAKYRQEELGIAKWAKEITNKMK